MRSESPVRAARALLIALLVAAPGVGHAQSAGGAGQAAAARSPEPSPAASTAPLVVAVREVPPFAMRDPAGDWVGLSVDLWRTIAEERGWSFAWRELPLHDTLGGLETGAVNVAIAALSITGDRELRIDFSHPYLTGGLSAAWRAKRHNPWLDALRGFAWWDFLRVVGSLAVVLLAAGATVWLFERRANPEQFGGGGVLRGLGAAFWWSAVTMTTVGYGDKAPQTLGGRLVAIGWMFASIGIIASFTGAIAASVTVRHLDPDLLRDRALSELRVGVLADSSGESHVVAQGVRPLAFTDLAAALDALAEGKLDVVVHDDTILRYETRQARDVRLEVSPEVLVRDDYGFGLSPRSALREELNLSLLSILRQRIWQELRLRYLGQ
jgi:ABC-type amino acid transport substrate-binding protein